MADLDRFVDAQDRDNGLARALAELRSGRKRTHWIWWVFPQLASLGRSGNARFYGIVDAAEAAAYLRHPTLGARYLEALRAVHHHVCGRGADLENFMGSHIDAVKLVSSLTLFADVAESGAAEAPCSPEIHHLAAEVLGVLRSRGWQPCMQTLRVLNPGGELPVR